MTSQDLKKGIDHTGATQFTASSINQTVDAGRLADDKGMRIVTTDTAVGVPDVPNPDVELEGVTPIWWKRYKWVRNPHVDDVGAAIKEYNWNDNNASDGTLLKWEWSGEAASDAALLAETLQATVTNLGVDVTTFIAVANNALSAATAAQTTADDADTRVENALVENDAQDVTIAAIDVRLTNVETSTIQARPVIYGGTGATTPTGARSNLGLALTPVGHVFLKDRKDAGNSGGDFASGSWLVRELNQKTGDVDTHVTLNGDNTFSLVRGNYILRAKVPAIAVQGHQARLAKWDGAAWTPHTSGTSEWANPGDPAQTSSQIIAILNLDATYQFRIEHRCQAGIAAGFGSATNFGDSEIYTQVEIEILSQ